MCDSLKYDLMRYVKIDKGGMLVMEMKINIKRCFYELWKKKKLIALIVLLSFLVGIYMMLDVEEIGNYSATASAYSMLNYGSEEGAASSSQKTGIDEFSEVVGSSNVAKRAVAMLDIDWITEENIQSMYNISTSGNFLYVSTYSNDKNIAVNVANAVAEAFVVEYKNLTGLENVQVFEKADHATYYSGDATNRKLTLIIYTGVGFFLVCVIVVLRTIFSAKVQDYGECTLDGTIELLGVIPEQEEQGGNQNG